MIYTNYKKLQLRPTAATPTEFSVCEKFVLSQIQPLLEQSIDNYQFDYKKARTTLDAKGLIAHYYSDVILWRLESTPIG